MLFDLLQDIQYVEASGQEQGSGTRRDFLCTDCQQDKVQEFLSMLPMFPIKKTSLK